MSERSDNEVNEMANKGDQAAIEHAQDGLPALFTKMADELTQLFDLKLALLKAEIKEDIAAYVRGGIMMLAGGLVVAIGFALLNIALAFLLSFLFESSGFSQPVRYALGFITTAAIYLVAGTVLIVVTKNRLAQQGVLPKRTIGQLERDKEWIGKEIQSEKH